MSNWIDKKRQEAFALYSRYLAMGLHLRAGSSYDYTAYAGRVAATFDSFALKKDLVRTFVNLSAGLDPDDIEKFVFANMRGQVDLFRVQKRNAVEVHKIWEKAFGDKEKFFKTAAKRTRVYHHNCSKDLDLIIHMIDSGREDMIEPVIAILHARTLTTPNMVMDAIKGNIIQELQWNRILKIRQIYYHLGILQ